MAQTNLEAVSTGQRRWQWLFGLCHRVAYATICGFLGIIPCLLPLEPQSVAPLARFLCYVFDLPVALITRLGIPYVAGADVWFQRGVGEFLPVWEMLGWHLRVAIPLYTAIFYLPVLLRAVLSWQRTKRAARAGAT